MGNINNNEFEFLNDQKNNNKSNKAGFLNGLYWILKIIISIFYVVTCIICSIIEFFAGIWFLGSVTKSSYKKKRKKKGLFF